MKRDNLSCIYDSSFTVDLDEPFCGIGRVRCLLFGGPILVLFRGPMSDAKALYEVLVGRSTHV